MEIIIPALTVGGLGLYINEKNKTQLPEQKKIKKYIQPYLEENTENNNYKTSQQTNFCESSNESIPGKFTSISGNIVNANSFKHTNMKPFFGSKVKQRSVHDNNYILDNMQGSGSEHFSKREQESLFKPTKDLGWNNGTPNKSDFIQSRMNPGISRNNTKPWEEVRVGPGLNKGYSNSGSGGFNSSLEARGQWIPKSVDELRAVNNPKVSYDGVTLGGKNFVTARGIEGTVEKNKPDTYYNNTPDRYLTTNGAHLAPTSNSEQIMGNPKRQETSSEYYGNKNNANGASYIKKNFFPSKKQQLTSEQLGGAHNIPSATISNKKSYNILPNARSTTEKNNFFGALVGIAKEVIMPLKETIRPSRKENVIGNLNSIGNVGVTGNHYMKNKQRAKTTVKETTASTERLANVGRGMPGTGYLTNSQTPVNTQRTNTTQSYFGPSGNTQQSTNVGDYASYYNAETNTNKEEVSRSRPNLGNMQIFNNECNMQSTRREEANDYIPAAMGAANTPNMQTHGSLSSREPVKQDDRLGGYLVSNLSGNPYNHSITEN